MKTQILFQVLLACCFSCKEGPLLENQTQANVTQQPKTEMPVFLLYGELAPVGYTDETDSTITKAYGFTIKRIADCDVTTEIIERAKANNEKNDSIMQQKYGPDWIANFEKKSNIIMAIPHVGK